MLNTKVAKVEAKEDGIHVSMEGEGIQSEPFVYDAVLVAIGRAANGNFLTLKMLELKSK